LPPLCSLPVSYPRDEFSAAAYTLKKRLQVYERPAEQEQEQEAPESMEVAADAAAE
jgi:hypothetical protein